MRTLRLDNGKNTLLIFSQERYQIMLQAIINPSIINPDSGYRSKMISFILLFIRFDSSCCSYSNFMTRTPKDAGKITSDPYTNWNGDIPIALFVLIMSAHKAYFSFVFQALLFSSKNFLIILTRILLEVLNCPLPRRY